MTSVLASRTKRRLRTQSLLIMFVTMRPWVSSGHSLVITEYSVPPLGHPLFDSSSPRQRFFAQSMLH